MINEKKITQRTFNYLNFLILVAVLFSFACGPKKKKPAPQPMIYELVGDIRVTNDCDGKLESIPNQVVVWAELVNASGNIGVYGNTTINLKPDPADPNNPVKIGVYSLQVTWPPSAGTPQNWKSPFVLIPGSPKFPTPTPIDVTPWKICTQINCPAETGPCKNMVPQQTITPAKAPFPTSHDIEVVCSCN